MLGVCLILLITLILSLCEYIIRVITDIKAYDSFAFLHGAFSFSNIFSIIILILNFMIQYAIISPLILGIWRCLYLSVRNNNIQIRELFYFYSSVKLFFRSFFLRLNLFIRQFLYLLILFLPAITLSFLMSDYAAEFFKYNLSTFASAILMFAAAVLWICAAIIYVIIILRYSFTCIIAASDDKININQSVKLSINRTNGYKFCIFKFTLSFIGWFLLCIFIFPLIYVLPYYLEGIAVLEHQSVNGNK